MNQSDLRRWMWDSEQTAQSRSMQAIEAPSRFGL
jgi:hypothetical protein